MGERGNSRFGLSRREVIAGAGVALAAGLRPEAARGVLGPSGETIARGTVFEDRAGTGLRQSNGPGIPGVMVSNGRDVVLTDAEGRFALAVAPGDSVFVIKPAHMSLSSAVNSRSFSYLHRAAAAHLLSIDFPLQRRKEPSKFDALLFADVQPSNATELGYFADLLRRDAMGTSAQFAINHGDVMGDDLSLFPAYRSVIEETGIPWHHCPGNHDMDLDSPGPRGAFDAWTREIGPTHYAFQHAGATFILLNNVDYAGRGRVFPGGRSYRGLIGERQLSFVENVLRHVPRDELVVVSMHIPLVSFEEPDSISDTTADRKALMRLLSERPHTMSFSGHSHTTEHHYLGAAEGFAGKAPHHHHVLTAASGSWWSGAKDEHGIPASHSRDGSPKGYHVLSVDGASYTTRFVPFGAHPPQQIRVLLPYASQGARGESEEAEPFRILHSPGAIDPLPTLSLAANVFDGGPYTRVVYAVDDSAPVEMTRTRMADPFIVETFARDKHLSKPWVKPAVSSHIWTARLDRARALKSRRVVVRAELESGQVHECAVQLREPRQASGAAEQALDVGKL